MSSRLSQITLIAGAVIIVVMILFPPRQFTVSAFEGKTVDLPAGYRLVFTPPEPNEANCPACYYKDAIGGFNTPVQTVTKKHPVSVKVASDRLVIQIVAVTIACGFLALALRKGRNQ